MNALEKRNPVSSRGSAILNRSNPAAGPFAPGFTDSGHAFRDWLIVAGDCFKPLSPEKQGENIFISAQTRSEKRHHWIM
jgi:hypothetical protein